MNRKPTDIKLARALQQIGVLLDTPVDERRFSAAYSKRWLALMDAHDAFMTALHDYSGGEQTPRH